MLGGATKRQRAPVCDFTVHLCRYMYWLKFYEGSGYLKDLRNVYLQAHG